MREEDKVLTAEEAAAYLRMALSTLYRYMRGGKIPCFRVGNRWRFKRSVLEQWIEQTSRVTVGSADLGQREQEATVDNRKDKTRRSEDKGQVSFDLGLGGLFKGLGSLLEFATELAEQAPTEVTREGQVGPIGDKGLKAVYGFSVKVGGGGRPTVESFGNVREKEGKGPVVDDVREPMVDTFDEGAFLLVVAELPGVDEKDITYDIQQDILVISGQTGERKYSKEVLLPSAVEAEKSSSAYKNGILEIKLWKVQPQ
jgi:HSP20 family protein